MRPRLRPRRIALTQICALKIGDFTKASVRPEEYRDSDSQARYYRAPEILMSASTYNQSGMQSPRVEG